MNNEFFDGDRIRYGYAGQARFLLHKLPNALNVEPARTFPFLLGPLDVLGERKPRSGP